MMKQLKAVWLPFWYELDQSIQVGVTDEFLFFKTLPDWMKEKLEVVDNRDFDVTFFCGFYEDTYETYQAKIISIYHPELGKIEKIDANGLSYTITLSDGGILKVEAEETPGIIENNFNQIENWIIEVKLEVEA